MIIILNPFIFYLLTWISATKIITSYQNAKKIENPCSKYVHTLKIMIICVARKLINFPVRDKFATKIEFEIIFMFAPVRSLSGSPTQTRQLHVLPPTYHMFRDLI